MGKSIVDSNNENINNNYNEYINIQEIYTSHDSKKFKYNQLTNRDIEK